MNPITVLAKAAVPLTMALCLLAGIAAAQSPVQDMSELGDVQVIKLKYAPAADVGRQIDNLMPDRFRFGVDARTNSLILGGADEETLAFVRGVVTMLDVAVEAPAKRDDELITRVFPLEHSADGFELVNLVESLFQQRQQSVAGGRGVRIIAPPRLAFDAQSGQVIARGMKQDLEAIGELIVALDIPVTGKADAPARGEMQIRLVWLVGGLEEGEGRAVPADLRPVTEQLSRLGIDGLRQVAQMLLRISAGEEFRSAFDTSLGTGWQMQVKGSAGGTEAARQLDIEIEGVAVATQLAQGGLVPATVRAGSLELSTSITTAPDHFVVLGVSPIGPMDSVFVVQIREE